MSETEKVQETPDTQGDAKVASAEDQKRARRRKRWDRITLAIIIAMIAVWAVAIFYRSELRAQYWTWRLKQADPAQRQQWINHLVSLGEPAESAALSLTGHDDPAVRSAGVQVLTGLLRQDLHRQLRDMHSVIESDGQPPEELALAPTPESRIVIRLRELLADPETAVQVLAIDGLSLVRDQAALTQLAAVADCEEPVVACHATSAIGDIAADTEARRLLTGILQNAQHPDVRAQAIVSMQYVLHPGDYGLLVEALADLREVKNRPIGESVDPALLAAIQREVLGSRAGEIPRPASRPAAPEKRTVADYAVELLRKLTGQNFGFDSSAPPADREAAIGRWKAYIANPHGGVGQGPEDASGDSSASSVG